MLRASYQTYRCLLRIVYMVFKVGACRACPMKSSWHLLFKKDLRVITGASTGADGGKATEVVPEGAGTFLVQKFVKSKGPHAFIIRQVCVELEASGTMKASSGFS